MESETAVTDLIMVNFGRKMQSWFISDSNVNLYLLTVELCEKLELKF